MSARESSENTHVAARFNRRGNVLLLLGLLLGPVAALVGQGTLYAANAWACGWNAGPTLHIVSLLAFILVIGTGISAYNTWRGASATRAPDDAISARTRFVSLLGLGLSALSGMVVVAQWAAVVVFPACARP